MGIPQWNDEFARKIRLSEAEFGVDFSKEDNKEIKVYLELHLDCNLDMANPYRPRMTGLTYKGVCLRTFTPHNTPREVYLEVYYWAHRLYRDALAGHSVPMPDKEEGGVLFWVAPLGANTEGSVSGSEGTVSTELAESEVPDESEESDTLSAQRIRYHISDWV